MSVFLNFILKPGKNDCEVEVCNTGNEDDNVVLKAADDTRGGIWKGDCEVCIIDWTDGLDILLCA